MHISHYIVRDSYPLTSLTLDQRRALEMVGRHDGKYGRTRLALTLSGEPDRYDPELGRDALRGAVPTMRRSLASLDALCELGLIEIDPTRGKYLVLRVTTAGARVLGRAAPQPRRIQRLELAEQVRFDRLVACRDELAREREVLPSSIARLAELREAARAGVRDRVGLQRVLSPGTFLRFGEAACAALA